MSFPANIAQTILDTVIGRLARLFDNGSGGDSAKAHEAARQMLSAYNAETTDELGLAAEIVSLQLHTLEALSDASERDLPLNKVLRLRGGAVSLSRESHKARRELDKLQSARRAGIASPSVETMIEAVIAQPATVHPAVTEPVLAQPVPAEITPIETTAIETTPAKQAVENALGMIAEAREAVQAARKTGGQTWARSLQKRLAAKRITDTLNKKQAQYATLTPACPGSPAGAAGLNAFALTGRGIAAAVMP